MTCRIQGCTLGSLPEPLLAGHSSSAGGYEPLPCRPEDQDRARCVTGHLISDRPEQQPCETSVTAGSNNKQVGVFCCVKQGPCWQVADKHRRNFQPLAVDRLQRFRLHALKVVKGVIWSGVFNT